MGGREEKADHSDERKKICSRNDLLILVQDLSLGFVSKGNLELALLEARELVGSEAHVQYGFVGVKGVHLFKDVGLDIERLDRLRADLLRSLFFQDTLDICA